MPEPLRLLELFSGTGSVGKVARELGFEVVSLDINPDSGATITSDICEWDYAAAYPPGYFDIVHMSPPCTEYSNAKSIGVRDLDLADSIVLKGFEILDYFKPKIWFCENPDARLKKRIFMQDLVRYDISYCHYGFTYRKHTNIWCNKDIGFEGKRCNWDCNNLDPETHKHRGQLCSNSNNNYSPNIPLHQKYQIPAPLVRELFELAVRAMAAY
jgi:hypothetical protein